jgi:hypothetical protein
MIRMVTEEKSTCKSSVRKIDIGDTSVSINFVTSCSVLSGTTEEKTTIYQFEVV